MDRWYEVYLGESKVGFAHSTMKLVEGEVRSESIFEMRIKRAGQVIEMKVAERTSESPDGKIIGFSGETLMAGIPILKKGWVENGGDRGQGKAIPARNDQALSPRPSGEDDLGHSQATEGKGVP